MKKGKRRGIQRYQCQACGKKFSSKRRIKRQHRRSSKTTFTTAKLSFKYGRCNRWIRQQISVYQPEVKTPIPRAVVLVIDATFFGKRKDKLGVLVVKDSLRSEVLSYQFIRTEQVNDYKNIVNNLRVRGFTIKSVTIDGKKGLIQAFEARCVILRL